MEIIQLCSGPVSTNTYVLVQEDNCLVIDPSCDLNLDISHITNVIGDRNCVGIWLTHGHYDHIIGVDPLVALYGCPVYVSEAAVPLLTDPSKNASRGNPIQIRMTSKFNVIDDRTLLLQGFEAAVIKTPGHTEGCITFIFGQKHAFVGDFIFKNSIGRTDLYGGSMEIMKSSLETFKISFDESLILYPGHGPITTLGQELKDNPFLR